MSNIPDGRYDHTHPWVPQVNARAAGPRYQFLGPFASNEERLTQQAIQTRHTSMIGPDSTMMLKMFIQVLPLAATEP